MRLVSPYTLVNHDSQMDSSVEFGKTPANGFAYLNNTWGRGAMVGGRDFLTQATFRDSVFPQGLVIEFNYPKSTGSGTFITGYPQLILGGSNYGDNAFTPLLGPWHGVQAKNIQNLSLTYDITLKGNTAMFDVLSDIYFTTSPTSSAGETVLELSFFPHMTDPNNHGNTNLFSFGLCSIYLQGTQLQVRPIAAGPVPRDMLAATVDMKEIITYLIAHGYLTGNEYIRGAEFGVETFNSGVVGWASGRCYGSMRINHIHYDWDGKRYQ